jgi:Rrf2 family protein
MVDLAQNNNGQNIALKDVARRQNISLKYLEQIITILNKAGYVISTRGSNGGYRLALNPEDYTVGMILRLTEGSLAPANALDKSLSSNEKEDVTTLFVWEQINRAVDNVIDNITIADIIKNGADNYVI